MENILTPAHIIATMSKGNPGAAMALTHISNLYWGQEATQKLFRLGILGTDIYVLFSDICKRNTADTIKLIHDCPDELLKDAASRQDYSGRELVKDYL